LLPPVSVSPLHTSGSPRDSVVSIIYGSFLATFFYFKSSILPHPVRLSRHHPPLTYIMDLANLISQPAPLPALTVKARASYSPPAFEPGSFYPTASTSYTRAQAPLSPPVEDNAARCSLPSISSLLDSADGAATHASSMTPQSFYTSPELTIKQSARDSALPLTERWTLAHRSTRLHQLPLQSASHPLHHCALAPAFIAPATRRPARYRERTQ
jgi:hypothetical protein